MGFVKASCEIMLESCEISIVVMYDYWWFPVGLLWAANGYSCVFSCGVHIWFKFDSYNMPVCFVIGSSCGMSVGFLQYPCWIPVR